MRRLLIIIFSLLALTAAFPCEATSIEISPPDADSYFSSTVALQHNNNGSNVGMVVRGANASDTVRTVIRFAEPSGLPASITAATLYLYYYKHDAINPSGETVDVNQLTETAWTELGVDWVHQVHDTVSWSSAGGTFTTTNKAQAVVPASFGWMTWDVASLINAMLGNGTYEFLLKYPVESGVGENTWWYTSDNLTNQPYLTIGYTLTDGTVCPNTSGTPNYCLGNGDSGTPISTEDEGTPEWSHSGGTPCYGCVER